MAFDLNMQTIVKEGEKFYFCSADRGHEIKMHGSMSKCRVNMLCKRMIFNH